MWSNYKRQMEAAAGCNVWTIQEKTIVLIFALTGKVMNFFNPDNKHMANDSKVLALEFRYESRSLKQIVNKITR